MTQGVLDQQLADTAGSTSTSTKYVYFFGDGKADGHSDCGPHGYADRETHRKPNGFTNSGQRMQ